MNLYKLLKIKMMLNRKSFHYPLMKNLFVSFIFMSSIGLLAQNKDTLHTQEINIIKSYKPTVSDAFKIKSNPKLKASDSIKKHPVNYRIFSFPVASTFTPSKGKAKNIVREPQPRLYDNYVSAGFGNYSSPMIEAYIHTQTNRDNDFGLFLKHNSSKDGVKDALLDSKFSTSDIALYYKQFDRDYDWKLDAGYQRKQQNFYGIPSTVLFTPTFFDNLDLTQTFNTINVGGAINFYDFFLTNITTQISNFSDAFDSNEIHLLVKPTIELPISTELINTVISIEMLSGKFKQGYANTSELKNNFLNLGINPNLEVRRDNLTFNLGVKTYYSMDLEQKENTFYAYPNITASLRVLDDAFILIGGVTGDLIQNSYQTFADENPWVSPTLSILPTDNQYNGYIGAKGKLASNISYQGKITYSNTKNKAMFIHNEIQTNGSLEISDIYRAENSFNVVYDDVKSIHFNGEINVKVSKEISFGGTVDYVNYTPTKFSEVWNTPTLKAAAFANFQHNKWFGSAKLFYESDKKDIVVPFGQNASLITATEIDAFVDVNLNFGYIFSDRLTAFVKANNITNSHYERFLNYQVQGAQFLGGITYKFDL
ncbi:MAG: TonB-dependent receptor [Flavobacteriaceae bacterium]|nr:MAG: TonB-dependent receptor [Flavobacteriaceae bacterium]